MRSIIVNAKTRITKAHTNNAARKFANLVLQAPASKDFWEVLSEEQYKNMKDGKKVYMPRLGNFKFMPLDEKRDTVFKGWNNGKKFYIKINDPRVYHAVKTTSAEYVASVWGQIAKVLGAPTRLS